MITWSSVLGHIKYSNLCGVKRRLCYRTIVGNSERFFSLLTIIHLVWFHKKVCVSPSKQIVTVIPWWCHPYYSNSTQQHTESHTSTLTLTLGVTLLPLSLSALFLAPVSTPCLSSNSVINQQTFETFVGLLPLAFK